MSIYLGNITTRVTAGFTAFTPIKIDIEETFGTVTQENIHGKNQFYKRNAASNISLEFDAISQSTLNSIRSIINNRVYEKKVFVNEPGQLIAYDFITNNAKQWVSYKATDGSWPHNIGTTVLTSGQYATIQTIDSNYFNYSQNTYAYTWIFFSFDISNFINAYGVDAIDRAMLVLHNPYCLINGLPSGYSVGAFNNTFPTIQQYPIIGKQSYSISDPTLRSAGLINQQFYSLRKVAGFRQVRNAIDTGPLNNCIIFCMVNETPRSGAGINLDMGFNYAGLMLNSYPFKMADQDNFTYRNSYTDSGYTGTLSLSEV